MALKMKLDDLFLIGEKTIFTGQLQTEMDLIKSVRCSIEIDGKSVEEVVIEGEMHTGSPARDLWSKSSHSLTEEIVKSHEVWLISAEG